MEYPNPKNERVSYTMSSIHSKDTKIEIRLRKAVWARGQWYRENYKKAPGAPDIAFVGRKIAVFFDSSFWHGKDWDKIKSRIKSNRKYWLQKIQKNRHFNKWKF